MGGQRHKIVHFYTFSGNYVTTVSKYKTASRTAGGRFHFTMLHGILGHSDKPFAKVGQIAVPAVSGH